MKSERIRLEQVEFIPRELQQDVFYYSADYHTASHLCSCGCGRKVVTPISPTGWRLKVEPEGMSLWPSVGNWQFPCRSHYVIRNGKIVWAGQWSEGQVAAERRRDQAKKEAYFAEREAARQEEQRLARTQRSWWSRLRDWLRGLWR